jgi:hypothetical protein
VANVEDSGWSRPDDGIPPTETSVEGADPGSVEVPAGVSRRDFVRGGTTAMGVGAALVWSGPAIRSIRLASNAGSPMPPTTPPTTSETVSPGGSTVPPPETSSPSVPRHATASTTPDTPDPATAGDTLPLTGATIATTAAAGAGAIVAGRALMSARRRPTERQ